MKKSLKLNSNHEQAGSGGSGEAIRANMEAPASNEVESGYGDFTFILTLDETTDIEVWTDTKYEENTFWLSDTFVQMGFLSCRWPSGILHIDWLEEGYEEYLMTRQQWLFKFRCGCWICGCDIEATTHEKIEWIQGFNREELEAWNLKF